MPAPVLAYLKYLKSDEAKKDDRPFCLIISLVNPHDVLFYMNDTFEDAGYNDDWLVGDIETPFTMNEERRRSGFRVYVVVGVGLYAMRTPAKHFYFFSTSNFAS
jgi:hypothetical protein